MQEEQRVFHVGDRLARLEDLPCGASLVVAAEAEGRRDTVILVHSQEGVKAYLNRCRHLSVPLDWGDGEVLDESGGYLLCRTHGALFRTVDGVCVAGPCAGRSLFGAKIRIKGGSIHFEGWILENLE